MSTMSTTTRTTPVVGGFSELRRRFLRVILTLTAATVLISEGLNYLELGAFNRRNMIGAVVIVVLAAVLWGLENAGRFNVSSLGTITLLLVVSLLAGVEGSFLFGVLAVTATAVLADRILFAVTVVLLFGQQVYFLLGATLAGEVLEINEVLLHIFVLLFVAITVRVFRQSTQRSTEALEGSAQLLFSMAQVEQLLFELRDLDELFDRAVNLIQEQFGFYHVQVFLVDDPGQNADLVASTGGAGRALLERKHRLAVGSRSVVGQATARGEAVVALDTESDPYHSHNELLPNTRAELALPIRDGGRVVGVLDVQSVNPDAFQPNDVQALQVMADTLSSAIRTARLFEAQNRSAEENQRLLQEAEANLEEIQRLNRQLTQQAWSDYLRQETSGLTLYGDQTLRDPTWTDTLARAAQDVQTVQVLADGRRVIAVPIALRGEVIGAIEVEADADTSDEDAAQVVESIANRLAVSLENARLFEESQEQAAQEQRINAILALFQSVTSVDDLLRVTLTELTQTLGASSGAIRLGSAPAQSNGNGSETS